MLNVMNMNAGNKIKICHMFYFLFKILFKKLQDEYLKNINCDTVSIE